MPGTDVAHAGSALLERLARAPGTYRGSGVNHEQQAFDALLQVEPLVDGRAVLLRYRATLADGSLAHEECTLLAPGPDGAPCLWPVMSELPVVLPHAWQPADARADRGVFASGPHDDTAIFREEITIALEPGDTLTYAHAWGLPGDGFAARSSARLARRDAAVPAGGPPGGGAP